MTNTLSPHQKSKILTPAVQRIMSALRQSGGEARIVGGAVRDIILSRPLGDIDFAANLPPERITEILKPVCKKIVPTGIAHGTLTAVIDHVGYEITTLRRDVATDGRHAQIAFTDDWREDAARRDFTMNALYVDDDGVIYDYFGGLPDAKNGLVRFIGDAQQRIREDVLRILRFFRFYAWFGQNAPDPQALQACHNLADLIPNLSAERVAKEILKLLAAPAPAEAWRLMLESGVVDHALAEATNVARLQSLLSVEQKCNEPQPPLLRLAALLPADENSAAQTAARLKLSNRDAVSLRILAALPTRLGVELFSADGQVSAHLLSREESGEGALKYLRRILYAQGPNPTRAALFLAGADTNADITPALTTIAAWENPVFPLTGEDIVKQGIPPGPRVGEILRAVENGWIESDFRATRTECLAQLKYQAG